MPPPAPRPPSRWVYGPALLAYGGLFTLLYATAKLAGGIAPFWLTTGLGVWLVLRFGAGMALVVAAGGVPAYLWLARIPIVDLRTAEIVTFSCVGRAAAAWAGAALWRWGQTRWHGALGRFHEPAIGVVVAFAAAAVAATVGVGASLLLGFRSLEEGAGLWLHWWAGDAIGVLFSFPLLLAAPTLGRWLRTAGARDLVRGAIVVAVAVGTSSLVFERTGGIKYLCALFPVLLLATVWFGVLGARLVALLLASAIIFAAVRGSGPFVAGSYWQDDLTLQLLLLLVALVALLLPAVHARRNLSQPVPLLLLLGGWIMGGAMFALVQSQQERANTAEFAQLADSARAGIEQRLTSYLDEVRIGATVVAAVPDLRREAWAGLADTLQLRERFPGIKWIGVVYPVPREETAAFLQRVRAGGARDFSIRAAGDAPGGGPEQFVVTDLTPLAGNESLLGLDLAATPLPRAAAEAARDTGQLQISARTVVGADRDRRSGYLLFLPVYRIGAPVSTVAERRAALRAWVYAPLETDTVLSGALDSRREKLQLTLFERGPPDAAHLLYSTAPLGARPPEFAWVNTVAFGGREFMAGWNIGPKFVQNRQSILMWLALGLAVITVLLTELVLTLQEYRDHAEELARHRLAAQRESEEQFRRVFETAPLGIAIARLTDGRFIRVNAALCTMLGYAEDELTRLTFAAVTHPDHHAEDRAAIDRLREGQIEQGSTEKRYVKKTGEVFWGNRALTRFCSGDGKTDYALAMVQDITARKQAEVERAGLEGQLRHAQKMEAVGTLAGGIAHDFNNILSGIYGYTGLAHPLASNNPELLGYLDEIGRASRRAAELVRQILAFSRTGEQAFAPVQLPPLTAEAVRLLRATTPATIEFTTHWQEALPAVRGNASQLHQVVMNLCTNAAQAMRDRPGRLTIRLDAFAVDAALASALTGLEAGPHVRLTVSDTGQGMDAATQTRIFEPFFTTKAPGEGSGLGLSVAHGIVRGHRGAIRLTSEVGRGTTFEIFFPALAANPGAVDRAEPGDVPPGAGERILLVDDEAPIARVGELALSKIGYRVVAETDALRAFARLAREPHAYELVVVDQTMPGLTGLEFAARLRALRADLPVVLVSGYSTALTPERLEAAGVRELLTKPYTLAVLAAAIRRHLPSTQPMADPMGGGI